MNKLQWAAHITALARVRAGNHYHKICCQTESLLNRRLGKEATKKIGFIVTTLGNPFFVNMTEAAEEEVAKYENIELLIHAPERETGGDIERQILALTTEIPIS